MDVLDTLSRVEPVKSFRDRWSGEPGKINQCAGRQIPMFAEVVEYFLRVRVDA